MVSREEELLFAEVDVEVQLRLARPDVKLVHSLDALAVQARAAFDAR
jgi:hypothetical protein